MADYPQKSHRINLHNDKSTCACKESTFEGLPCRHELCVYVKGSKPLAWLNFHRRWTYEFFEIQHLPPIEQED